MHSHSNTRMTVAHRRANPCPYYNTKTRKATHKYDARTQSWQRFTDKPATLATFRDSGRTRAIVFIALIALILFALASCNPERCVSRTMVGYGPGGTGTHIRLH